MSYAKAMRWQRTHRKGTRQPVLMSTLEANERRRDPWLGGWAILPENAARVTEVVEAYRAETARMLVANPGLKLI